MSEHDQSLPPHTAQMAAAVAGMGGLSPSSTTSSVPTSTPNSSAQANSGSQRLGALESIAGELYGLSTPIFPPTTFDLPDINFSNSVNSSVGAGGMFAHHGMFDNGSGGQLMGDLTISSHNNNGSHQQQQQLQQHSSHHQQQLQIQQSLQQIQQQQQQQQQLRPHQQFPPAACSPRGTSSSDDSDDLPLAQLAKRQTHPTTASTAATPNTSISEEKNRSGSNSPNNSTTLSTATTTSGTTAPKKAKPSKRKKKKDPNEPQKPVSAYALFFRDTQATIKGHNPSASFGEVSKIVASMWDQLDPEHKDVYKKKTETAKKQYLKQLAAYRASQVSQSASDETEKSPSPPAAVAVSPPQAGGGHMMSLSPNQQPMGNTGFATGHVVSPPHMESSMEEQQQQIHQHQQQQMMQMSPQHQMMQQQQQHHMMQQQMQQQHMHQMQQQQQQQMMTMSDQLTGMPSPPQHQQQQQQHHSPPQQHDSTNVYNQLAEPSREMDLGYPHCVRMGCTNQARENPAWDSQYCSNDCVITHCRDIFTTWVSARSGSNSFPVK
ncbi:hypothetical protein EGW08_006130 [Elysia chlorotica]|uniref:HMG box domain-containing protein n=1 Tax=Elysia chlorotica TaxID=188477 RepID=A0A3S1BKW0_ELYCH|nr:hypothetical protein EGW08_006130 [Elysia chlorotica]